MVRDPTVKLVYFDKSCPTNATGAAHNAANAMVLIPRFTRCPFAQKSESRLGERLLWVLIREEGVCMSRSHGQVRQFPTTRKNVPPTRYNSNGLQLRLAVSSTP
jgi:hypothetical protein